MMKQFSLEMCVPTKVTNAQDLKSEDSCTCQL